MLILTRKAGEAVIIGENDIRIVVVEVMSGNQVRLGFDAPDDVDIFRQEVFEEITEEERREKEQGPR